MCRWRVYSSKCLYECICVYMLRGSGFFFLYFHFYKYKNTTLWEKNKEDEEKAKCVTKDRTAATQSFGKVLVHQVIQYYTQHYSAER